VIAAGTLNFATTGQSTLPGHQPKLEEIVGEMHHGSPSQWLMVFEEQGEHRHQDCSQAEA
jgi:hypothetical protein